MKKDFIVIKGARDNNLKNIDVVVPKNKLVVFTGVSGSGKSTLAFDTLYNEGRRRYVESLSSYARQFLGGIEKPDVDSIEGLSPAIAIEQKTTSNNPRSTVGTTTEIYDYLRLLYARVGTPYCPNHHIPIKAFSVPQITDLIYEHPDNSRLQILAPIVRDEKGTHKETLAKIRAQGFERLRVDGKQVRISELEPLEKNTRHTIEIIVDRIALKESAKSRIYDALMLALDWGRGYVRVIINNEERFFSTHHACPFCGFSVPKLEPRLFSFNAPLGCCPDCNGLGVKQELDPELLIPDDSLTLNEGAIEYYKNIVGSQNLEWQDFMKLTDLYGINRDVPYKNLSAKDKDIILNGSPKQHSYVIKSSSGNLNHRNGYIEGVKTRVERLYHDTTSEFMRTYYAKFLRDKECTTCHGSRLNEQAMSVQIAGKNIYEVTKLSIKKAHEFILDCEASFTPMEKEIARLILIELKQRFEFLLNVGLDYLTLDRLAGTLSGGEAQRIRLATQIGSKLNGVLYVLDEPSIGLHQKDNTQLINTLKDMVNLGNTLVVVEHDEDTILAADHIIDLGPGAGVHGGEVVASGTAEDIKNEPKSITGQYLSGKKFIPLPPARLKGNGQALVVKGARQNNLKNIDVSFPLGKFICVTGVSGSGKSSLVNEILDKAVKKALYNSRDEQGDFDSIEGLEYIDKVIDISQDPIGRTPRSNPATYTKTFDEIRELFANTIEAKSRGFDKGTFSFNVKGGRCEVCEGAGVTRIPMNFLPDVYVRCHACDGKRYNNETLQVTYKGKTIYDVLEMTVEAAGEFFENQPRVAQKIKTLNDVGLGYIKLGQSATTLSGGEAQRVKLANELQKRPTGKSLYLLDEPTTGLHASDIARLLVVLQDIVNNGDTVIVIEHNLDVIKVADWIIDLGPDGGDGGGYLVAEGTPEQIAANPKSYTGQYLGPVLKRTRELMQA